MINQKKEDDLTVCIIALGCPKNLVDSEIMSGKIARGGYLLSDDLNTADYIIINTCTFINDATSESLKVVFDAIKNKKNNAKIIIAGCMAQRFKEEIFLEIPEADHILGTGNIDDILTILKEEKKTILTDDIDSDACFDPLRIISTPLSYTFIKIAEGCDKKCTFCVIPSLRGKYRSRALEDIVNEAKTRIEAGYKELVLIAEDTAYYGKETDDARYDLARLLFALNSLDGDFSIRLLYCYPEELTDDIIDAIARSDKVIKYLDIPIQHISDRLLKTMGRKTTGESIKTLITKLKVNISDITLRTSLITGFPGETEEDFNELCEFITEYRLDHVGVFSYSREAGTPAYKLPGQIGKRIKEKRRNMLMEIQKTIVHEKNESLVGLDFYAVIDGYSDDGLFYKGRIPSQAPEIDTITYILGLKDLVPGDKVNIKVIATDDYDLIGEITDESSQ